MQYKFESTLAVFMIEGKGICITFVLSLTIFEGSTLCPIYLFPCCQAQAAPCWDLTWKSLPWLIIDRLLFTCFVWPLCLNRDCLKVWKPRWYRYVTKKVKSVFHTNHTNHTNQQRSQQFYIFFSEISEISFNPDYKRHKGHRAGAILAWNLMKFNSFFGHCQIEDAKNSHFCTT